MLESAGVCWVCWGLLGFLRVVLACWDLMLFVGLGWACLASFGLLNLFGPAGVAWLAWVGKACLGGLGLLGWLSLLGWVGLVGMHWILLLLLGFDRVCWSVCWFVGVCQPC